jgi:hypothetical protein
MAHDRSTTREIEEVARAEIPTEVASQVKHADSSSVNNGSEAGRKSDAGLQGDEDPPTGVDEALRNYYFGPSTITVSHIWEMGDLRYFAEGDVHELREETVPEPADHEAIVFEEFFVAGLRMPLHSTIMKILLKFRVQLHQLMPNVITQLSKHFWAVVSF